MLSLLLFSALFSSTEYFGRCAALRKLSGTPAPGNLVFVKFEDRRGKFKPRTTAFRWRGRVRNLTSGSASPIAALSGWWELESQIRRHYLNSSRSCDSLSISSIKFNLTFARHGFAP
jgi:hypothetical protein